MFLLAYIRYRILIKVGCTKILFVRQSPTNPIHCLIQDKIKIFRIGKINILERPEVVYLVVYWKPYQFVVSVVYHQR